MDAAYSRGDRWKDPREIDRKKAGFLRVHPPEASKVAATPFVNRPPGSITKERRMAGGDKIRFEYLEDTQAVMCGISVLADFRAVVVSQERGYELGDPATPASCFRIRMPISGSTIGALAS